MNELGAMLIGAAVRGTAFVCLGAVVYALLRRRGPSAGSQSALATLLILSGVSVLSFSPWPRWWTVAPPERDRSSVPVVQAAPQSGPTAPVNAARPASIPATLHAVGPPRASVFLDELWRALQQPPAPRAASASWGWQAWCVVLFLAVSALGFLRLALGLRQVHLLRGRSRPIEEPDLRELAELLRAEAGCTRPVAIRESAEITTPATVGWLRPVVLLPACWRDWDEHERRVVLAHELAHVRRNDYLSGVLAQLSVCLHFYHPMAHWLMGRLRLEQELAADSWGARLAGGGPLYLTTLAQMALRQADRPVRWPARAFLPVRGTLLRRIDMLRDATSHPPTTSSRAGRFLIVGVLSAAGLLVAGFRGPNGARTLLAQEPRTPTARPDAEVGGAGAGANGVFDAVEMLDERLPGAGGAGAEFDLTYVPTATDLLVAVKPADLITRPECRPIAEALRKGQGPKALTRLPLEQIEQALFLWLRPSRKAAAEFRGEVLPAPSVVVMHSAAPLDWKAIGAGLIGASMPVDHSGRTYQRASGTTGRDECYYNPDDRTMIFAREADLQYILGEGSGRSRHAWDEAWAEVQKEPIMMALSSGWIAQRVEPRQGAKPDASGGGIAAYGPLWTKAQGYAASIRLAKGLAVDVAVTCGSEDGAKRFEETARAALTLAGNLMDEFRRQIGLAPRESVAPMQLLADTLDPLLERLRSERKGRIVHVRSSTDVDLDAVVKVLLPGIVAARVAENRNVRVNHLKMLALAMHNYHDVNGKFPPAVLRGPDGKTPYSWRVALLPYLEQQSLYDRYKFDEPWNGPNNIKILDEMPAVFGDTVYRSGHNAAFFGLVGPDTLFGVAGGTNFPDISDGTSNTVMFVEARRDIPWTKPEDVPYGVEQPLPELGGFSPGGFNAAFADGSVRFISSTVDAKVLRALITRAGGENVNLPGP